MIKSENQNKKIRKYMKNRRILALTGIVGNVIEWYDFVVYGYFAKEFGKLFFPSSDPTVSLILSFSAFGIGFFARPVGSLVLGYIGDKKGRKPALLISVLLMGVPSIFMISLPTYYSIGLWAPVILTAIRLLQGFSSGGEYTLSISFLFEHAPSGKKGAWSSFNLFGAITGILLGSLVATIIKYNLPESATESYGWRIAYIPTIILVIVGYIIRSHTEETEEFLKENPTERFPLSEAFAKYRKSVIVALSLSMVQGIAFYTLFVYFPTYFSQYINVPQEKALLSNSIAMIILDILVVPCAYLSDKIGRKPVLLFSLFLYTALSIPLNKIILTGHFEAIVLAHSVFGIISGFFMGTLPVTIAEIFPTNIRTTSFSVLYNFSLATFGGTAPTVATYFIGEKKIYNFPGIYLSIACFITFLVALAFLDKKEKNN